MPYGAKSERIGHASEKATMQTAYGAMATQVGISKSPHRSLDSTVSANKKRVRVLNFDSDFDNSSAIGFNIRSVLEASWG